MSLKDIKLKDPNDIREMRAALNRYACGHWDTAPAQMLVVSMAGMHLLHTADAVAYHHGLNGEDKYTLIAYNALLQLEQAQEQLARLCATRLEPMTFKTNDILRR